METMKIEEFSSYYKNYEWEGKHHLFGYPPDTYPNFSWIKSLETRFDWLRRNFSALKKEENVKKTASIYLIKEMIEWGGSQNGVLQKFNDRCGEVNLYEILQQVIESLPDHQKAIEAALKMPGLGLTYSSKLLRFLEPEKYGALDSRIRGALENKLGKITISNNNSTICGYCKFLDIINEKKIELESKEIKKPKCSLSDSSLWRAADIEMSIFESTNPNRKNH
jgi:hypothetical protein